MGARPSRFASAIREVLEELAALPHVGFPFGLALLPVWCLESLERDAHRTGMTTASIARWAFLWPLGMVVALLILSGILLDAPALTLSLWIVAPIAVGGIVATRARGVGGIGVAAIGLLVAGGLLGIAYWLIVVVARPFETDSTSDPIEALLIIPLLMFLVPALLSAQLAVGVLVVSVLSSLTRDRE